MRLRIIFFVFLIFALTAPALSQENLIKLSLDESIKQALENNLDIQIARVQLEETELELNKAEATYKIKASLSLSPLQWEGNGDFFNYEPESNIGISLLTKGGTSYNFTMKHDKGEDERIKTTFSLDLAQQILPSPKFDASFLSLKKSLITLKSKKLWLNDQIDNLKLEVKTGFYAVLRGEKELEMKQLSLQQAKQNLIIVKDKLEQGMANQLDLLDAQGELMAAEETLFQVENSLFQSLMDFKNLLGINSGEKIALLEESWPSYQSLKISLEEVCEQTLANNLQMEQQNLTIELRQLDLAAKKSEASSSLNASLGYNYNQLGQEEGEYRASLILEIPLLDGSKNTTEIKIAQGKVEEAELGLKKLKRDIIVEVQSYFLDLERGKKRMEFCRLSQGKSQKILDVAKNMFWQGAITEQELREKEISLKQAEINLLDAIVDYEVIRTKLLKSSGKRV